MKRFGDSNRAARDALAARRRSGRSETALLPMQRDGVASLMSSPEA